MELITRYILNHLLGLAANLNSDYIITAFKDRQAEQLLQEEETRKALKAYRPIAEDVRLACIKLAEQQERLWVSPAHKQLRPMLFDPRFHEDFVEWLQLGAIEEGEPVKARMIQRMETLLAPVAISDEHRQYLHHHFFNALEKAVFADETLSRWRFNLSLRFLRGQAAEVKRLAEEAAGKFSEERQSAALESYCRQALDNCDIIDLTNLPDDRDIATQKLLLRQLYMPLRVRFETRRSDGDEEGPLDGLDLEKYREAGRLRDAGRSGVPNSRSMEAMGEPVGIGERLGSGQRFVVLGDPGGGKTTMLRWLATAYLLRHLGDPAIEQLPDVQTLPVVPWIPVLIRCRDIGEDDLCRSFKDVLAMHLNKTELQPQDAQVMVAVILDRLARGEILLLVDGLDEISDRRVRQTFCQQLEKTAARYPEAPILVTSRIVGYRAMPDRMRTGFAHGVISDLDRVTKDLFATRWVEATEAHQTVPDRKKSSQALIAALHSSDRIERLTGNPMLLTTMALVKRKVGKLPTRRNKLYAEAVSVLLNWNPSVYSAIEEEEALPQLAFLAFEMCRRGVQQLNGDEVLDLLDQLRIDYPKIRSLRKRDSQDFLHLLEERSGLLMRSGMQWQLNQSQEKAIWEFRHLTFQEYLAAHALLEGRYKDRGGNSLAKQIALLVAKITRYRSMSHDDSFHLQIVSRDNEIFHDTWREVLRLLVADCRDDEVDDVFRAILLEAKEQEDLKKTSHQRILLAAHCLAMEPNVSEGMAIYIIQCLVCIIGSEDCDSATTSSAEEAAFAIWESSIWRKSLRSSLINAFSEKYLPTCINYGRILVHLLGTSFEKAGRDLEDSLEILMTRLYSPESEEVISAALTLVHLSIKGTLIKHNSLEIALLSILQKGGAETKSAVLALAWLNVDQRSSNSYDVSSTLNNLEPPLWKEYQDIRSFPELQVNEQKTATLLAVFWQMKKADDWQRHLLIGLLGYTADVNALPTLLEVLDDPVAIVRKTVRHALAWMANHLAEPLPSPYHDVLVQQVNMRLIMNSSIESVERSDGLVLLALFGCERQLRETLYDLDAPVLLRRRAAEALGIMANRFRDTSQRNQIKSELNQLLHSDVISLLVTDESGWDEHDRRLPLLQGVSRGLQLAVSSDLPLLGEKSSALVPMLTLSALAVDGGLSICSEVVYLSVWRLPLPGGEQLEFVLLPSGSCSNGSHECDSGCDPTQHIHQKFDGISSESYRGEISRSFYVCRFPITQGQWRAVAGLIKVDQDLDLHPSLFEAEDLWDVYAQSEGLPVENVSWYECQEWILRLNQWLAVVWTSQGGLGDAPRLALPSEGQWKEACMAGASTPFHFGDTLDSTWSNYDARHRTILGRLGNYRGCPIPVGSFGLFNRWGLAEMHGQVSEWCGNHLNADLSTDQYPLLLQPPEATDNLSEASSIGENEQMPLRGGSWWSRPEICETDLRLRDRKDFSSSFIGFRPCCYHLLKE